MNNFKSFVEENKNKLNTYAKEYTDKLEMPEILKESIQYSLVNDGKKSDHCLFCICLSITE